MSLSNEDALRLNVLLANKPQALRIDESSMTLCGLLAGGNETRIGLNPTGRTDQYLRKVREMISGAVLGSPGGYPLFLNRWTRMGQARDQNLEELLLLAEPEAVVAVVCAKGLTDELARRAWWAMEDAENARRMLENEQVVAGSMGRILAAYLVEYLPFETEPETMIESIRLVLRPGLIDAEVRRDLWKKAARKPAYYLGFLAETPDDLPESVTARGDAPGDLEKLNLLARNGNRQATLLTRLLDSSGQAFLETCERVLRKPANQEVVTRLLSVVAGYFRIVRPSGDPDLTLPDLVEEAAVFCAKDKDSRAIVEALSGRPHLEDELRAMRVLSGLGYGVARPVFRDSSAIGSLMRRKLEPVITGIQRQFDVLRGRIEE